MASLAGLPVGRVMAKDKPKIRPEPKMSEEEIASVKDTYQLDVMSFVDDLFAKFIAEIPDYVFAMTNAELFRKANPAPIDYALRTAFWREYDILYMSECSGKIQVKDVCKGICSPGYFYNAIKKSAMLLWMIKPKQTYHREMEAILSRGIERLWEIIEIPIYGENNKVDHRLASVVLQAIKQVEDRVQGMAVQRTQSIAVNLNEKSALAPGKSMDDINAKIKELEQAISGNGTPGRRDSDGKALPPVSKKFETLELRPIPVWESVDGEPSPQEQAAGANGFVPSAHAEENS